MSGRKYERIGQVFVVILLLYIAFRAGMVAGIIYETRHKAAAHESLTHAIEVIDGADITNDEDAIATAFDTVLDDIRDALAWMEKKP